LTESACARRRISIRAFIRLIARDKNMNKAAHWSIKGVDFDAREAAKEAARRDGLTLGEWMNRAISDRAAEIGAMSHEIDVDERLEAIAAQLARLSGQGGDEAAPQKRGEETSARPDDRPPPGRVTDPDKSAVADDRFASDDGLERTRVRRRARPELRVGRPASRDPRSASEAEQHRRDRFVREGADAEALLEQAVAAFEKQAGRVESGAARAIADVTHLIEASKEASKGERALALAHMDARLAEFAQNLQRGEKEAVKPLRGMIESVHARLGEIETCLARKDKPAEAKAVRAPEPPAAPREERFASLEKRFDAMIARLDRPLPRFAPAPSGPLRGGLKGAIDEIAARQRDLEAGHGPSRPPAPRSGPMAPDAARIDRLQDGIEALSSRIEDIRKDLAAANAQSRAAVETVAREAAERRAERDLAAEIDALCEKISEMGRALSELAPCNQVISLENAIVSLAERIEQSRDNGMNEKLLAPIEALAEDVRRALADTAPLSHFDELSRRLREVEGKLDYLRQTGGNEQAEVVAEVRQAGAQTEQIRAMIAQLSEKIAPIERLERQVAALGERLEFFVRYRAEDASGAARWAEVGARLDDLAMRLEREPSAGLEPILRSLTDRLNADAAPRMEALAIERLERRVLEIAQQLERGDTESERRLLRAVEDLIERLAPGRDADAEQRNAREIADLRERTESSDRLAQQTLSAVHETLEKVVDRLAMLEEDLIEARDPVPAQTRIAPNPDSDNFLMEPGAGRPSAAAAWRGPERDDPDERDPPSRPDLAGADDAPVARPAHANYIDIARRALAARTAAEAAEKQELASRQSAAGIEASARFVRPLAATDKNANRRLAALMVSAVSVFSLGAYQAHRWMETPQPPMQAVTEPEAEKTQMSVPAADKAPPEAAATAPAAPEPPVAPSEPAPAPVVAPPAPAAAPAKTSPSALNGAQAPLGDVMAPRPLKGLPDPLATGSIGARPNSLSNLQSGAQALAVKELAERGEPAAEYDYGVRLAEGRGISQDQAGAIAWFEKAASRGVAQAQYRLGLIYEKGTGAPRDLNKAHDFYEQAADRGHVRAMHNLAVVLAEGVDGRPDYAAAALWFRRAAEYGVRDSQFNLAILYARGMGVPRNLGQSYAWFAIAALQGDDDAAKKRDEIGARLDAATLEAARKQAAEFHAKAPDRAVNEPLAPAPNAAAAVSAAAAAMRALSTGKF
jgi:localization factor PodJL